MNNSSIHDSTLSKSTNKSNYSFPVLTQKELINGLKEYGIQEDPCKKPTPELVLQILDTISQRIHDYGPEELVPERFIPMSVKYPTLHENSFPAVYQFRIL